MTLLVLFCFVFIFDYGNDVRQKANLSDIFFLFEFKMGHKAVKSTHNINNTFGKGTGNECSVQQEVQEVLQRRQET